MNSMTKLLIAAGTAALGLGLAHLDAGGFLLKKKDIPKAIAALKTGTPMEKIVAAKALGKRGAVRATDVKGAVPPLKMLVEKDADAGVRAASAEVLGMISPEPVETVKLLLKVLKEDKEDSVKIAAMNAIGRMRYAAKPALPELRKLAKDKDNKKLSRTARNVLKNISKK